MRDIACGIQEAGLIEFAAQVNAWYMGQWLELGLFDEGLEGWGQAFEQAVTRTLAAGGRIHFNLTGLDVGDALAGDPDLFAGRYTAYELQQIVRHRKWLEQTIFYHDGRVLAGEALISLGLTSA